MIRRLLLRLALALVAGVLLGLACAPAVMGGRSFPAAFASMGLLWLAITCGSTLGAELGRPQSQGPRERPRLVALTIAAGAALALGAATRADILGFEPAWLGVGALYAVCAVRGWGYKTATRALGIRRRELS